MPGPENQLELFDLSVEPGRRPRRESLGRLLIHLRYDQAVLAGIIGLLGLTVVFASGVERGKQLARTERTLLRERADSPAGPSTVRTSAPAVTTPALKPLTPPASPKAPAKPVTAPAGKRRYAVQVVTYSRPQLAKQELQRLQANGEAAFLVMRHGRTSVYVGPFPSRERATEKVAGLKMRYQDCFVKTL